MSGSFEAYPLAVRNAAGEVKIVRNEREEQALIANGYERPGKANPAAYMKALAHVDDDVVSQEYPKFVNGKIVHDPNAPPPKPVGAYPRWINGKVIETEEDDIAALLDADEEMRIPAADRATEREQLIARATQLGIRFDGRWGLTRLREVVTGAERASDGNRHGLHN